MSDYNPLLEEGTDSPLEGSPDDVGVAAEDGQPTEQPTYEEPPRSYLDPSEHADAYVRVKVDGQDVEVPLNEALQGYSRTADYTRKTQELAAQRQQAEYALTLQRALQARPAETLRLLAQEYGLANQQPQSPPQENMWEQPSYDDGGDSGLYSDPVEERLNQQQQMIEQLSQREALREANTQLRAAIGGIQQKYNLDEATTREIVGTALQYRLGPESFEMIYKNIAFDRAQAARAQLQAQRSERDLQRETAKTNGQQLVGQGGSANGAGGPQPGVSAGPLSIAEAFEAAEREHGTRF